MMHLRNRVARNLPSNGVDLVSGKALAAMALDFFRQKNGGRKITPQAFFCLNTTEQVIFTNRVPLGASRR